MQPPDYIELSAGSHAFGDGNHPTTRMVLAALAAIDPQHFIPRNACDMGAGSGILSFAMARQFGCPVVAVELERRAVEIIKENARANGIKLYSPPEGESNPPSDSVGGQSTIKESPHGCANAHPAPPQGGSSCLYPIHADGFRHADVAANAPFDLIGMNILADPLLMLAADAHANLAAGGVCIISGLLLWQEAQIREAYAGLGLELAERLSMGDWVCLVWQKE